MKKPRYTDEQIAYFKKQGKEGGKKTLDKHGTDHYKRAAQKRWAVHNSEKASKIPDSTPLA